MKRHVSMRELIGDEQLGAAGTTVAREHGLDDAGSTPRSVAELPMKAMRWARGWRPAPRARRVAGEAAEVLRPIKQADAGEDPACRTTSRPSQTCG
jgi:hypothetical protein